MADERDEIAGKRDLSKGSVKARIDELVGPQPKPSTVDLGKDAKAILHHMGVQVDKIIQEWNAPKAAPVPPPVEKQMENAAAALIKDFYNDSYIPRMGNAIANASKGLAHAASDFVEAVAIANETAKSNIGATTKIPSQDVQVAFNDFPTHNAPPKGPATGGKGTSR